MFFTPSRAGRLTVARLFTLAVLAIGAAACASGPLVPRQQPANPKQQDGLIIEPVAPGSPMMASSLLAAATPVFTVPSAQLESGTSATPMAVVATSTPSSASPTPSASVTPGPSQTPAATTTARPTGAATPGATVVLSVTPSVGGTVTTVQAAASVAGSASGDMSSQELSLINATRTQAGLPAIKLNATLNASANAYAKLMADRNFFSHDGIDGSSPQSRIKASGYSGRFKGEALAAGQGSPQSALNTWLNSPAHRDILMDRGAVEAGVGYYSKPGTTYTTYWVFVSGTP